MKSVTRTCRPFVAIVAAVTMLMVGGASTASAFHIPGALYTGTHSDGGDVSFRVSANGTTAQFFRVEDYETDFCDVDFIMHTAGAPIVNHAFTFSSGLLEISYSGTFPGVQLAQGTFSDTECATGTLTWTARTTASPAGSEECIAAQGPATEAEAAFAAAQSKVTRANKKFRRGIRQAKNAKRAVKRATKKKASTKVKRKTRKRLRRAVRKRTRFSRELRRARNARTQAATVLTQTQAAKTAVCGPGV